MTLPERHRAVRSAGSPARTTPPDAPPRTAARYELDAARAVSKVTHRKVDAMISKHDAKTGIATEVFILEQLPKKY